MELPELLKRFVSKSDNSLYYPVEIHGVFRFASNVLGIIPSGKRFYKISFPTIQKLISTFGFIEIFEHQSFIKTENHYQKNAHCLYNREAGLILDVRGDDDDGYIPGLEIEYEGREERGEGESGFFEVTLFYSLFNNHKYLTEVTRLLEKAAREDCQGVVKKSHINFLCYNNGYKLKNIKVNRKIDNNLELNYGPEFMKVYDRLLTFLNSDDTGLALLYGVYGSGKTSFIRYLLGVLNKRVIYVPPHLIRNIAEPDFLSFILRQNDFILVIEDAEEIVTNRQDTGNVSSVSNLLNLSDGILGDCIKARIICTFNTEIKNIDPALTRKGRLKINYEFKALEPLLANKLLKHLNINYETKEPMSLSNIYNWNEENFRKEEPSRKVGFGKDIV